MVFDVPLVLTARHNHCDECGAPSSDNCVSMIFSKSAGGSAPLRKNTVYEEPRGARNADLTSLFHVGFDFGFEFAAVEARLKRFLIQMQCPGAGEQFSPIQLGLLRVQCIVILPKLSLLARAASRFGRPLSLRVDFAQREVEVGELYSAAVLGEDFVQTALALLAIGALKV